MGDMNERQLKVCAIALFCDGWSNKQAAYALGVNERRAQQLIETGANEQASGTMGRMRNCPVGEGMIVGERGDTGEILKKVPESVSE